MKMMPYLHSRCIAQPRKKNFTYVAKEKRMQELVRSLQLTLEQDYVSHLYIFYQDSLLIPYLEKHNFTYKEKIVFVPNMEDSMATLFRYANEHLEGHVVMVMNADVYPLEGFEQIDFQHLRNNKLAYCLSRYMIC